MEEKIILSIEIPKPEGEKQVDDLTKKIVGLQKANKDLADKNKELAKSGKQNSKEYIENSRQIEINKQKITEATSSRKGLIQTLLAEDNSVKALNVRNKELIKQRDKLNPLTAEGAKKIAEINAEINQNNKAITANSSALEKQFRNVGNYKSALDGLIPGLSGFIDKSIDAAKGVTGLSTATKLLLGPIGLLIIAGTAVVKFLTGSEEGMDLLAKTTAQVSAVFDVLVGRLIQFGQGLVQFLSGNYKQGIETLGSAFKGVGDEIEREIKLAGELADVFDQLEERELSQSLRLAEQANQIKLLMIASRNRSLSEEQRSKKLSEALELEKKLNSENLKLQEDRIEATARDIQRKFSQFAIEKQVGESAIDFAKRIAANESIVFDVRKNLTAELIKYNDITDASANIQEKIINQQGDLTEKLQARIEKEQALNAEAAKYVEGVVAKIEADRLKSEQEVIDQDLRTQMAEDFIAQTGANSDITLNIAQREFDRKKKLREDNDKFEKKSLEIKKDLNKQELANMEQVLGVATSLFRKKTAAFKVTAIGQAIINTYLAATSALAPPPLGLGPVAGIPLAVVTIAAGLVNVAKIAGVEFAKGGLLIAKKFAWGGMIRNVAHTGGVLRGPSHRHGGIPFTVGGRPGFEAEGGEAIINKRSTKMFRPLLSQINEAGGGVSFSKGGVTKYQTGGAVGATQTRQAFQAAESRSAIRDTVQSVMENMPPIFVSVVDINERASEYSEQSNKAFVA